METETEKRKGVSFGMAIVFCIIFMLLGMGWHSVMTKPNCASQWSGNITFTEVGYAPEQLWSIVQTNYTTSTLDFTISAGKNEGNFICANQAAQFRCTVYHVVYVVTENKTYSPTCAEWIR